MLGILLMIAKIIGIILLCILGLFFALVLLVLFIPVPYRIYVNGDSGDSQNFVFRIKIFGVQVFPKKDASKKARRLRRTKRIKEQTQDSPGAEAPQIQAEEPKEKRQTAVETQRTGRQTEQKEQPHSKALDTKTKNIKTKNAKAGNASGKDVRGMLKLFYAEFTDEGKRRALRHLLRETRYLIRHFGPRRVRADVCFSLGDPANTGYATAALSMCPFSYGKNCRILPDFEAEHWYVQGWLDMRGHVRAVHVLLAGLRLLFDRNVRKIIGKILKKK